MLLVDKYSPKKIEDILGNKEIISTLKSLEGNFPHLLFTGPPGTGKTTMAHILKPAFDCLELNASDDRGIDVIRTKVKNFSNRNTQNKLIILDECDSLTTPAQQALRRLMEISDAKFILICNNISSVIEPVQSRCCVLKFDRISSSEFMQKIKEICINENINMHESGYSAIADLYGGDMRACLNCLQGLLQVKRPINGEFLYKLNGTPTTEAISEIMNLMKNKRKDEIFYCFEKLWKVKYEPTDLFNGFFKAAKELENYEALKIIGEYHFRATEGNCTKLQFYGMFNDLLNIL